MGNLSRAAQGIASLEEYALKRSFLGAVHPCSKLIAALCCIVCAASFPAARVSIFGLVALLFYPASLAPLAGLPYAVLLKRIFPALPFALAIGAGNFLFSRDIVPFIVILLKSLVCVSAVIVLMASTAFHVLLAELRRLRLPAIFCLQLALCYRYISVIAEEAGAMLVSYHLRLKTSGAARNSFSIRLKDAGPFLGSLLLRSFGRAGEVWSAMRLRGFNGSFRTHGQPLKAVDFIFCVIVCGVCIAVRMLYAA